MSGEGRVLLRLFPKKEEEELVKNLSCTPPPKTKRPLKLHKFWQNGPNSYAKLHTWLGRLLSTPDQQFKSTSLLARSSLDDYELELSLIALQI
jgi:hypothetical protein